jgi:hypothetical protein
MTTATTTNPEALVKAKMRALAKGVQVLALSDPNRFICPAKSCPGVAYEVVVHPTGDLSCDCKAGQNGRPCKHVGAVMLRLGLEEEMALAPVASIDDDPTLGGLFPGSRS